MRVLIWLQMGCLPKRRLDLTEDHMFVWDVWLGNVACVACHHIRVSGPYVHSLVTMYGLLSSHLITYSSFHFITVSLLLTTHFQSSHHVFSPTYSTFPVVLTPRRTPPHIILFLATHYIFTPHILAPHHTLTTPLRSRTPAKKLTRPFRY